MKKVKDGASIEKRGSWKILAQSRNLGSVFDGSRSCFRVSFVSRSLEFFWPTGLGFVVFVFPWGSSGVEFLSVHEWN